MRAADVLLPALLALLARAPAAAEATRPDEMAATLAAVDHAVRDSMERHRTPGVALALTDRYGLVAAREWGFADLKLRRSVTGDTLFQIGSITKSFTALALLQLVDERRLDLEAPVARYLPWFSVRSEFAPIRVVHLLTHTAGIPANRDDIVSSPMMARALGERSVAWPPGSRFHYSNVGYQVLHQLLERVTGESYERIVERRLFAPLGMTASRAAITLESRAVQAVGYLPPYDDRPPHRSRQLVEAPHLVYRIGDGSIQSTAAELAVWVRMWLNRGRGPHGRLVSKAAFERFATPHPATLSEDGASGYGLGVGIRRAEGRELLAHGGGMVGFSAYALASPSEGLGVAVLMNGPGEDRALAEHALAAWRAAIAGEPPPAPTAPEPAERIGNAGDYAGSFAAPSGERLRFVARGERLLVVRGEREVALERVADDAFYTPEPGLDRYPFAFARDAAGEVVEVTHGPAWHVNERYAGPRDFVTPAIWSAYAGRYRSFSPWLPYFEMVVRKGELVVITGEGGESDSGEIVLVPLGDGLFQLGAEPTPERLLFEEIVDGRALRAVWSGHPFFRQ